jgi:malate synthase
LPRKPRPGVAPTTAARAAGRAGVDRARKPGAALRKRAIGKGAVAIGGTGRKTTPAARPSAAALRPSRPARSPAAARPGPAAAARTAGAPSAARPAAAPRGRTRAPRSGAVAGVVVKGKTGPRYAEILSPGALSFLAGLHRQFDGRRRGLLAARAERQRRFDAGELPDFLPETRHIRAGDWKVGPIPKDLTDRRVEITGPVDRKMIVNALNCGATHFMADFEDANSPTWANNIEGQINLKDRWEGKIAFTDDASGKRYQLGPNPAVLIVRPRGWHLVEEHLTVDGEPISGALFDFGLYFFHNVKNLLARGTGPYFYLPKMESHREARLWNDVFVHAQDKLGIPRGTIKVTVLIETLPAAFEMDEILYELREHAAGLNAGRWDYIFSFIKKFAKRGDYVLPDRGQVVMGKAFLGAYAALLIKTCHRRRAFAMGGMAAQIPIKGDPAANEAAFAKVRADKEREVRDGHDGTWVAHPDLVPVAKAVFDRLMRQPNQLDRLREDVRVTQKDLLEIHQGTKTEEGFRLNIRVGVQYIEAWLRGRGAVPIYNLMEDAATAEISRAQIWQWLRYGAVLDNGVKVTPDFFKRALGEEMERVKGEIGAAEFAAGRFPEAIELFRKLSLAPEFEDFLTIPAYKLIV